MKIHITFVCYHLLREVTPAENPAKASRVCFIYGTVVKRFCSKEPTAEKKRWYDRLMGFIWALVFRDMGNT